MAKNMKSSLSYCGALVREHDPDRFLLSMFAPVGVREDLWALFAFNYEIAKTREVVSETQLGLIRLQWWRDAIAAVYEGGNVPEHEVVTPLAAAIKAHDLPRDLFDMLIYAREFDLEDVLPSDMDGFLNYADYTSTPLMKLAVQISGGSMQSDPVGVVAVNYAVVGILRSALHLARARRCLLPQAVMQAHGAHINQFYELKRQDGLKEVARECAGGFAAGVRADNRFLRAAQGLSAIYMQQLKRYDYDLFEPRLTLPPAFKELRVWFSTF